MSANDANGQAASAPPMPSETSADSPQALRDIIAPGLSILFCGINPGLSAASTGHHFAGRGNRFWKVLHRAGLTNEEFRPENDRDLLRFGYGLTAAVARPTANASQLSRAEFHAAAAQLEQKVRQYEPRIIAFLGKMALAEISGKRDIEWGLQASHFGGARAWVLPNPSGLNRSFSLDALVSAYRELRIAAGSIRD